ncbi:unnamed protein product [Agarophyton chilense]
MKCCRLLLTLALAFPSLVRHGRGESNRTVGISLLDLQSGVGYRPTLAPVASAAVSASDPPPELPPHGVHIYDSLHHLPTRLLSTHTNMAPRCAARHTSSPYRPYVCGSKCENVLLAMRAHCKAPHGWVPCAKARKFRRCLARVCYRATGARQRASPPVGFYDRSSVAIVRYHRPLPLYERRARRNRQSSTQSAIFK